MKVSLNWLQNYIDLQESPEKIVELLTQSGLEVASLLNWEVIKGGLEGLVIGEVVTCEKHSNADRLKVVQVEVDKDAPLSIVCGAPNVAVGQKVIVAPAGTTIYNQQGEELKIKRTKVRGVVSEGMICAEDEIGVGDAHDGIMVLDTTLAPGTPAARHFKFQKDKIVEIDLTPNRGDACSHIGVARELGALLDRSVQLPSVDGFRLIEKPLLPIHVEVQDYRDCPRYSGVVVEGITVKESPRWLRDQLRSIGIHPVNNVVDVTNFVMHELGQPLHAFDYDQIVGSRITVGKLEQGINFVTLDDKARRLNGEELMVCDAKGGLCMAGVLGGKRGSIHASTQRVFIESAYFTPSVVRKGASYHALKTEASFRYERGTDPDITVYALKRAVLLLQEMAEGSIASEVIDIYPQKIARSQIKISYKNIARLIGVTIPETNIKKILHRLDIAVSEETADGFVAYVPPYRVDVCREVDVIEEIVRIYGYDRLEVSGELGSSYLADVVDIGQRRQHEIATLLADNGYHEICTNSLTKSSYATVAEEADGREKVSILNPLSDLLNVLRDTLLFSGLEVIAHNINRKQTDLKLFEFGRAYHKVEEQYLERHRLGIWLTGNVESLNWIRKPRSVAFHDINAAIYKTLYKLGITTFTSNLFSDRLYEYGVQITVDKKLLLSVGKLRSTILEHVGIGQEVFFADVDWEVLQQVASSVEAYQEISKFPPVRRDLSLVLDQTVTFDAINKTIAQQAEKLIKEIAVFDVYQGDTLAPDKKAYTLSFLMQGKDKTLDERTIDKVVKRLIVAFERQLGAIIRE